MKKTVSIIMAAIILMSALCLPVFAQAENGLPTAQNGSAEDAAVFTSLNPETGDSMMITLIVILAACAIVVVVIIILTGKKNDE